MTAANHQSVYDRIAAQLQTTTNVGRTGDERDVYFWVDQLLSYLERELPPFACGEGCAACCHHPPFITAVEWAAVHEHLQTLDQATRTRIAAAASRLRPLQPKIAKGRKVNLTPDSDENVALTAQCPMLLDGKCAVYAARPLTCRLFGQTAHIYNERPRFFGCELAEAQAKQANPQGVALPVIQPYRLQMEALSGETPFAYLPEWLWAHMDQGRLTDSLNLTPDFDRV